MPIKSLTNEQHRTILVNLLKLANSVEIKSVHPNGIEYTSLMVCFLKHSIASADSILRLYKSFGEEYFPVTVGYVIVRPMFEIDVTAHYITQDPATRARQYIEFESVIKKRRMDACMKHRDSQNANWREAMELTYQHDWKAKEAEINSKFNALEKGQKDLFKSWSGKTIKEMAKAVNHQEAYDIFYADLSSFTHADVRLADRFLHFKEEGIFWSSNAHWSDVGGVFRYADIFLTCFLTLFGNEFKLWADKEVNSCWPN